MALSVPKFRFPRTFAIQRYQGLIGLAILLIVAFRLDAQHFYAPQNLANVLNQLAVPGILAVGMTFVILTGGIDLSVGSLVGLINCIAATWIVSGAGVPITIAYCVGVGVVIGALMGWIVSATRLQPFIVTLAAMVSLRGLAYVYTNNGTVSGLGKKLEFLIAPVAGIPVSAWIMLGLTALAAWTLWGTVFGRNIYALGGNEEAARYAGLKLNWIRIGAYAVNGLCVALAALVFTARNTNGDPSAAEGYELDAITAVVVGGTSLVGGVGGVLGTFLGALFIVCLNVLLVLKGVNTYVGMGWKGLIILVAVYLQNIGRRT
ncbi:MAG TPA: ABC transporter permease [Fimbriimonadaceae bacterium]|nr:ABC transporter permease [Fimbriimonadaceae bacterium]